MKSIRTALENVAASRQAAERWRAVNAFISESWDEAFASAERLEENASVDEDSPLYGQTLAVKDNFCTKGVTTTCGSRMLADFIPPYTATVVQRLMDRGMVVVGKTNMDSFAMGAGSQDGIHGPTRNTWSSNSRLLLQKPAQPDGTTVDQVAEDDFHISGGSSGGSAVAVSAGIVYGALGSDTGGSVRIPASYCGVVGLKPTYGLLSRHGLIALMNSMDCPGIFTQTVDRCANILNAVAGHDPLDSTTYHSRRFEPIQLDDAPSVRGLRVGIPKEYLSPHTTDEVIDTWETVAEALSAAGAEVRAVSLPHTQYSIACYSVLNCCEVASNMARYDGIEFGYRGDSEESTEALFAQTRHHALSEVVRGRILHGNYFLLRKNYNEYYIKAAQIRRKIYEEFKSVFDGVDILLTPTTISDAPLYSQYSAQDNRTQCVMQDVYTQPSNFAGVPALSIPIRLSENGLPLSLQLICRQFDEWTLLNTAKWIEKEVDFTSIQRTLLNV